MPGDAVTKIIATPAAVSTRSTPKRQRISDLLYSWLLVLPALIILLIFAIIPLAYAINVSFRFADLTSPKGVAEFVGLANFHFALNDSFFWESAQRTLVFAISAVVVEMVLGIGLAFLLNSQRWFKGITRSLFILPLAISPYAIGLVWRYMYHPDFGVFNQLVSLVGLPEQNWLSDPGLAMASIVAFDVWQWTPFVTLIALAGLQALPKEPFEAARLDNASPWRVLRTLTFPMLAPVLTLVLVLRAMDAVRLYDAVVSLTAGGPGTSTETLTYYLYRLGLKFFRVDRASAMALLFMFATVVFTGLALRRFMKQLSERAQTNT